jgi:hypothetical protein
MTRIDVNAFIGSFPFRAHPGGTAAGLRSDMARVRIDECWVSHLSAMFWRDPMAGNAALVDALSDDPARRPVLAAHPGLPGWEAVLDRALGLDAPCVRADPTCYGLAPAGPEMRRLAAACGERGLPLQLAVRLEDGRQRHPHDVAAPLEPWVVRTLLRSDRRVRLLVTHADRDFIEQAHWGSTPDEAARVLWDICWIWGPPEDHLLHLVRTIGAERFCFGTGMPLRLPEASVAKLDLTPIPANERAGIESGNARALLTPSTDPAGRARTHRP